MSLRLLPIFPLPLVLFPHAAAPLHIFEPRYRQLLADCLAGDRLFGIVCLPEGADESAIPGGTVGSMAYIETVRALPDGRSNIVVTGRERFVLDRFVADPAAYRVGSVAPLADDSEPAAVLAELASTVRVLFTRVGDAARTMADASAPLPDLPDEPAGLSFVVAHQLNLDLARQQSFLASRSPLARLQAVAGLLGELVDPMEAGAELHARARTNGKAPHAGAR